MTIRGDVLFVDAASDAEDDGGDEEDELDNCKFDPSYAYSTISFQKRQALGKIYSHSCRLNKKLASFFGS